MSRTTAVKEEIASHPRLLTALFGATLLASTAGTAAAGGSAVTIGP